LRCWKKIFGKIPVQRWELDRDPLPRKKRRKWGEKPKVFAKKGKSRELPLTGDSFCRRKKRKKKNPCCDAAETFERPGAWRKKKGKSMQLGGKKGEASPAPWN